LTKRPELTALAGLAGFISFFTNVFPILLKTLRVTGPKNPAEGIILLAF